MTHRRNQPGIDNPRGVSATWWALLPILLGGCVEHLPISIRLDPEVERPPRAVVLISVDGFAANKFDQFLDAGDLPNIQRLLVDRGVRVRRAVAGQPTITYASFSTILTGRHAGHHGILGNKWFDRYALVFRNYATMATYRWVGDDYLAPNLFEQLAPASTVSIQNANCRGATRTIDNWASSGLRWFVGAFETVDQLIPLRMELIAEQANTWGAWPRLIHAYMPAVDEVGHHYGADSPRYRRAAVNVDRQVGRLFAAVQAAGMTDRTFFVFLSDHGHVPTFPASYFDVAKHLRSAGLTVQDKPFDARTLEQRRRHYDNVDAVVIAGGDRRAVIHLPGPGGWHERPQFDTVRAMIDPTRQSPATLWENGAVKLALAARHDDDGQRTIEVYSRKGHSRLTRRRNGDAPVYGYEIVTTDALDGLIPTGLHDAETWLTLTADSPLPDFVVPLVELFDSPRAGDIMLVARKDWEFVPHHRGGHGGVDADDVLVPMVFAGPDLPQGATIDHARLVDIAPTILGLLAGAGDAPPDPSTFDGIDRSRQLRATTPPP
ncbi:MAG TPA: alkaline phosphatase family protein [Phycisphaerae bacterium]|nr:alkaline phosphatase family protein [Phycisphaerae bacterium]